MSAWIYILRLKSGKLYIGVTRNREKRYKDHFSGMGCQTTKFNIPIEILYKEEFPTYSDALKRERQLKRWSRAKKEALIHGDLSTLHRLARRHH